MRSCRIAPSILSADFARLGEEVRDVIAAGAGADLISVHPDASTHVDRTLRGGQGFIDSALRKIERVRRLIDATGRDIRLEVDGGIKVDNIRRAAEAGADTFVAGSAIFGQPPYRVVIEAMQRELGAMAAARDAG